MTGVVSRERARATWLTGVAGLVILAVAFVMMACAAPSQALPRSQEAMTQPASVYTTSLRTGSWPASLAGRAGQGRGAAGPAERRWSACAIVSPSSAARSSHSHAPSRKDGSWSAAACNTRRVLPTPPGPVTVTSGDPCIAAAARPAPPSGPRTS
jgi:hypothetical protein